MYTINMCSKNVFDKLLKVKVLNDNNYNLIQNKITYINNG